MNKLYSLLLGGALALFGIGTSTADAAKTTPYKSPIALSSGLDDGWIVIDGDNNGRTWGQDPYSDSSTKDFGGSGYRARFYANSSKEPADDWLISPAIHLEAGKDYKVIYYYRPESSSNPKDLDIYVSTSNQPDVIKTSSPIYQHIGMNNASWAKNTLTFSPEADGDYYVSFYTNTIQDNYYIYLSCLDVLEDKFAPDGVKNLVAERDPLRTVKATLTWTLPTLNVFGEPLTEDQTVESVNIYRDGATTPTVTLQGPATTFVDTQEQGLEAGIHTYDVEVVINGAKSPKVSATTKYVGPVTPATLPHTWACSDADQFEDWTQIKGVGSRNEQNWTFYQYSPQRAKFQLTPNQADDDYLISPPFAITEPGYYKVTIKAAVSNIAYNHKLALRYGTSLAEEDMQNEICESLPFTSSNTTDFSFVIKIDDPGTYYFGAVETEPNPNYGITVYVSSIGVEATEKTPAKVTDLTVTPDASEELKAVLTWTAPTKSSNGEDMAGSEFSTEVYKGETKLATLAGDATSYTDSDIEKAGVYTYSVKTVTANGATDGPVTITSKWIGPHVVDLPYETTFSSSDITVNIWEIVDANNDGKTWHAYSGNSYRCTQSDEPGEAENTRKYNDYFLTPYFELEPGYYRVSFKLLGGSTSNPMTHNIGFVKAGEFDATNPELNNQKEYKSTTTSIYSAATEYYIFNVEEAGRYQVAFAAIGEQPVVGSTSDSYYFYGFGGFKAEEYPIVPELATELAVTAAEDQKVEAVLTWTNPTATNYEEVPLEITKAVILRDGQEIAEVTTGLVPGETSSFTDSRNTGLTSGKHTYGVEIYNEYGKNAAAAPTVTLAWVGGALEAPATFTADPTKSAYNFKDDWKFVDADGNTGNYSGWSVPNVYAMRIWEGDDTEADDWAISVPMNFKKNAVYKLTILSYLGADGNNPFTLDLCMGDGEDVANYTKIADFTNTDSNGTYDHPETHVFYLTGADIAKIVAKAAEEGEDDEEEINPIAVPAGDHSIALHATSPGVSFVREVSFEMVADAPNYDAVLDYTTGGISMILKWPNLPENATGSLYQKGDLTFTAGDDVFVAQYGSKGCFEEYEDEENYNGVVFSLDKMDLTDNTEYTLSIPAGFVSFIDDNWTSFGLNEAQEIKFIYGTPQYTYMEDAEILQTMEGAVQTLVPVNLTWGENVSRSINQYSVIIRNVTDGTETVNTSQGLFHFLNENGEVIKSTFSGETFQVDMTKQITKMNCRYQLVLPARIVENANGDFNKEQVIADFFYGYPPTAELDYTAGGTSMILKWNNIPEAAEYGALYNSGNVLTFVAGDDVVTAKYNVNFTENEEDDMYNGVVIKLDSLELTDNTEYTLSIPEGFVSFIDGGLVTLGKSEAQEIKFLYKTPAYTYMEDAEILQTMSGAVETLVPVNLTWGENVSRSVNEYKVIIRNVTDGTETVNTSQGLFHFIDEDGKVIKNAFSGETFQVDMTKQITKMNCKYQLVIPARIVLNDEGEFNKEQVIADFYYGIPPTPTAELDYTAGGTSMILKWNDIPEDAEYGALYNSGNVLTFTAGDEVVTAKYNVNFTENEEEDMYNGVVLKIETLGLTDNTEYTLSIPEGFVSFIDGGLVTLGKSEAQEITFLYEDPKYSYMDEAEIISTMEGDIDTLTTIELTWGEKVSRSINEYAVIIRNVTENEDVTLTSQGLFHFLDEDGKVIKNAFEGETFQVDVTTKIEKKDCQYQIVIPARIVLNDEGEFNPEQIIAEFFYASDLSGIDAIEYDVTDGARYFTLQGFEVTKLTPGTIYIKVVGNKSYRVLVK